MSGMTKDRRPSTQCPRLPIVLMYPCRFLAESLYHESQSSSLFHAGDERFKSIRQLTLPKLTAHPTQPFCQPTKQGSNAPLHDLPHEAPLIHLAHPDSPVRPLSHRQQTQIVRLRIVLECYPEDRYPTRFILAVLDVLILRLYSSPRAKLRDTVCPGFAGVGSSGSEILKGRDEEGMTGGT